MTADRSGMRLVKAHALGNDFLLLLDRDAPAGIDLATLARRVCDRHRGIGADGLMVVEETAAGARTQLLNADGSPSEISGNGVRSVAAWLASTRGLSAGAVLTIETEAGPKRLELLDLGAGRPVFRADMGRPAEPRLERLEVGGESVDAVVLRVGNPQCVVLGSVASVTEARLRAIAGPLAVHPFFAEGTNVELAAVETPGRVRILIWERGVGPTDASGTGACAAAVAAAAFGGADRKVDVVAPGGTQHVEWTEESLFLTGWAEVIADLTWLASHATRREA